MADTIRPFSSGCEYMDWKASNCAQCAHGYDDATSEWLCPIERAHDTAYMDTGDADAVLMLYAGWVDGVFAPRACAVRQHRSTGRGPLPPVTTTDTAALRQEQS